MSQRKILEWYNDDYPKDLLDIKDSPTILHTEGNTSLLNNPKGIVAIVGSRNCTEYGIKQARIFAEYLSKNGVTVISGLAIGIDAQAHLGALNGEGSTIAVIGGGLNNVSPNENIWLYHKIVNENGLVISEKEDDVIVESASYSKRNRIITGIAKAVLVIEASKYSGSSMTARIAKEQGREVFCLPNRIDSQNSGGINYLIENGTKVVTRPITILKFLMKNNLEEIQSDNRVVKDEYKELYELLDKEKNVEEIAKDLDMDISDINTKLTMMELDGLIIQTKLGMFKKV